MKNLTVLIILILNLIGGCIYLIYEANTFVDFSNSSYTVITSFVYCFDFAIHIWITTKLIKFINHFETIIEKSEQMDFKGIFNIYNEIYCRV